MSVEGISVERLGHTATVTLDRPGQHNSISFVMWQGLAEIFAGLATDKD
jgi:enoyl-CoA hydratase/carnithine racemase